MTRKQLVEEPPDPSHRIPICSSGWWTSSGSYEQTIGMVSADSLIEAGVSDKRQRPFETVSMEMREFQYALNG